jgi:hypothetical protein
MFLENKTLSEVLEASDICLMINYCTTASLEAMFNRVPVIYLNTAVYPLSDWQDNLSENYIHRVVTFADMEKHIDSILKNPEVKRKSFSDANTEIRKLLGIDQFRASRQLLKILEILLENDRNKKNYNEILSAEISQTSLCNEFSATQNSITGLMYVSAYLGGFNGLEEVCLYQIFQKFNIYKKDSIAWVNLRWMLYQAFILGNIDYAVQYNSKRSIIFLLLKGCMFNPHRLMSAPLPFKKSILIYFSRFLVSHLKLSEIFFKFKKNV